MQCIFAFDARKIRSSLVYLSFLSLSFILVVFFVIFYLVDLTLIDDVWIHELLLLTFFAKTTNKHTFSVKEL